MRARRRQAFAASPVVVGAVTVLITIIGVFLAYNANNGLPFVPTYRINVQLPNAETLVRGNEVRIGGVRVGRVSSVTAHWSDDGEPVAIAALDLNEQVKPLPADSTILVRPRSTVALKYLEITPGDSSEGWKEGTTTPLTAARPKPVELDQVLSTFDEPTRKAAQHNLAGFGNALAGRGESINEIFTSLASLVQVAEPAASNLAARKTDFGGFWDALAATAAEVAPVSDEQAEMFTNLDTTFGAFAAVAYPYIQDTISKSPPALEEGTRSLPALRPFFTHSKEFFRAFEPGAEALARTSPTINAAFEAGIPVLRKTPRLNAQLEPTAQALLDFQNAPGVQTSLDLLIDTNKTAKPALRFITPAQSTCNYLTLLFRNVAEIGSLGDGSGNWLRFIAFTPPEGVNSESSPAAAPADDAVKRSLNHIHYNPYPYTASPGQPAECEAGNEVYEMGVTTIGNNRYKRRFLDEKSLLATEGQNVHIGKDGKRK